ncbi:MAG: ion transporter [Pseudomonadota bacterium]
MAERDYSEQEASAAAVMDRDGARRARLRDILAGRDPDWGVAIPRVTAVFIVATAIAVALETVKGLPPSFHIALFVFEIVATLVFAAEYALRLYVAERRLSYALSFWGIVDLLAFLPTLLFLGMDLLALRTLRLLRLLRLLKLVKNDEGARRVWAALVSVWEELTVVLFAAGIVLYLAATGIYLFEHKAQPEAFGSVPESLWWAVATLTTVGYGDVVPVTVGGRIFTGFVMLVGIGIVAASTGLVATALMAGKPRRRPMAEEDAPANPEQWSEHGAFHAPPAGRPAPEPPGKTGDATASTPREPTAD